ncbi:MAG: hypothetical protein Q8K82_00785 [Gemmatimonadaceae bacterium]|nr:hypothetical protein [Gemmatimonadaceae bacterium]
MHRRIYCGCDHTTVAVAEPATPVLAQRRHVDYDITPLDRTALPAIESLREWGASYRMARQPGE